jgi:hypothetical protein
MMRAVMTIASGPQVGEIASLTTPRLAAYARRLDADFISLNLPSQFPHFEKFRLYDFLAMYDRMVFLDIDVIVNDSCPDLFALVSEEQFGAWLASRHTRAFEPNIADVQQKLGDIGWSGDYFNSGVMVVSRAHRQVFARPFEYYDGYADQTLINYRVQRAGLPIFDLGWRLNHTGRVELPQERFTSHIIHYAGGGHTPGMDRAEQIRHDLRVLGKH